MRGGSRKARAKQAKTDAAWSKIRVFVFALRIRHGRTQQWANIQQTAGPAG